MIILKQHCKEEHWIISVSYTHLDGYYQFCTFVIANYHRMIEYTFAQVCKESDLDPRTIIGFLNYLGFDNYEDFHRKLVADDILRNDQIRARLLSMSYRDLFRLIEVNDYDIFMDNIVSICHDIYLSLIHI